MAVISHTPYVLDVPVFPFRALASAAERLPIGGDREVALATLIAARLVWGATGLGVKSDALHRERAAASRTWFASHPLPTAARSAFYQLADAVHRSDSAAIAASWERVLGVAAKVLDGPARAELRGVVVRPLDRTGE